VVFDEAGMTLPSTERSPAAKFLQQLGYGQPTTKTDTDVDAPILDGDLYLPGAPITTNQQQVTNQTTSPVSVNQALCYDDNLQVKCLSVHSTLLVRATDGSAGYDLFSAVDKLLPARTRCAIPLDITITPPVGTYAQIMSRSGLSLKHNIDVRAGTIDCDYTGNVQVLLDNASDVPFQINTGDRIAQMVLLRIQTPDVSTTDRMQTTTRGSVGFGSTGLNTKLCSVIPEPLQPINNGSIRNLGGDLEAPPALSTPIVVEPPPVILNDSADIQKPYDIYFSTDLFDQTLDIDVPIKGDHPTLGILTDFCDYRQRLQVRDMALSTPGSRLKNWRTVIRKAYILKFNDFAIQSQQDLEHAISQTRLQKMLKAKLVIATDKSYGVHPMEGILQIHFDQLNVIAKHLEDIKRDADAARMANLPNPATIRTTTTDTPNSPEPEPPPAAPPEELAQAFTKKQLVYINN